MRLRLAAVAAGCALACAAPAVADTTTTLGPGDRSPVDVAGSGVKRGDRLTPNQLMLRRLTTAEAGRRRTIRITCPEGTVHGGLATFEITTLGFAARNRYPGKRTAVIDVFPLRDRDAKASIFALCVSPSR